MSAQRHTPGPWRVVDGPRLTMDDCVLGRQVWGKVGSTRIAFTEQQNVGALVELANARRIVAAVNACEGIPTEALESGVVADLLEACMAFVMEHDADAAVGLDDDDASCDCEDCIRAKAAIAKATGGAP